MNKYRIRHILSIVLESMGINNKALAAILQVEQDNAARLARIESALKQLVRVDKKVEADLMALRATDQALINEVHRTQDVQTAANKALVALVQSNVTLTKSLADAIANSAASDDEEVKTALAALVKSNDDQAAVTPVLATAVANTDPTAPPPVLPPEEPQA